MAGKRRRTTIRRKRGSRRRTGRMAYKRRYGFKKATPRGWKPFGNSRIAKLTYCDTITVDPGVNTVGQYRFKANGLYDPDVAVGGHQPYGFDQLMNVYNNYTVLGSKITVTLCPTSTWNSYGIGVKTSDLATLLSLTPTVIQEQPGYRYRLFTNGPASPIPRVTGVFSAKKFLGNKIKYNDNYTGTTVTDPQDVWYYHVLLWCPITTTDLGTTTLNIRIDYTAKFFSANELNQS